MSASWEAGVPVSAEDRRGGCPVSAEVLRSGCPNALLGVVGVWFVGCGGGGGATGGELTTPVQGIAVGRAQGQATLSS